MRFGSDEQPPWEAPWEAINQPYNNVVGWSTSNFGAYRHFWDGPRASASKKRPMGGLKNGAAAPKKMRPEFEKMRGA